jgi:hypothetical protein
MSRHRAPLTNLCSYGGGNCDEPVTTTTRGIKWSATSMRKPGTCNAHAEVACDALMSDGSGELVPWPHAPKHSTGALPDQTVSDTQWAAIISQLDRADA